MVSHILARVARDAESAERRKAKERYDSGLINLAIPDGDENGIWTGISVPDSFVISDVSVTLDIEHEWIGDLGIALVDPSGDFIWLIDDPTCMNANAALYPHLFYTQIVNA